MTIGTNIIAQNLCDQEEYLLYDASVECYFLAVLMKEPGLMLEAERLVPPTWINTPTNRYLYEIMLYIYRERIRDKNALRFDSIMMMGVAKQLGEQYYTEFYRKTENMRHVGFIENLQPSVNRDQFPVYVGKLKDIAARVKIYRDAREAQKAVLDPAQYPSAQNVALEAERRAGEIRRLSIGSSADVAVGPGEALATIERDQKLLQQRPDYLFITCPRFPRLMALLGGGVQRRSLNVITARAKTGKSSLLTQMAVSFAVGSAGLMNPPENQPFIPGIPTLYLDTEMTSSEFYTRALASLYGTPEHEIIRGQFSKPEYEFAYNGAKKTLSQCFIRHQNVGNKSIDFITSLIRQFRRDVGNETIVTADGQQFTMARPCVVFFDWMRFTNVNLLSKNIAEYQWLGHIAGELKAAADECDLPIIAAHQENRESVGKSAAEFRNKGESFVAGSDKINHLASTVMSLHWADEKLRAVAATKPDVQPFTHMLSVMLARKSADFRQGLPLLFRGDAVQFSEVADQATLSFVATAK